MTASATLLHRKALLSKVAALVAPLNASLVALRRREARAETVDRIAYMAVAEALRDTTTSTQETQQ